jgi:hypothetical protein
MQIITETELLERIQSFRARHNDMALTTFGRNATGNANLIKELEEGRSPSLRTVQRIVAYMEAADASAALRAKLDAPFDGPAPEEVDQPLPFSSAPVNRTGASSQTSSSTSSEPSTPSTASATCPLCSSPDETAGSDPLAGATGRSATTTPGAPPYLSDADS